MVQRRLMTRHCNGGPRIETDGGEGYGWLLYIKSGLHGTEPMDILSYALAQPTFPHESTLNQFFTESQFESYRRLGSHIVEQITCHAVAGSTPIEQFVNGATAHIASDNPVEHARWPGPFKASGSISGTINGSKVELSADIHC